jgi:hypothetical protein
MKQLPARQVHLDFHTSEFIPEVGKQFDGEQFARIAKDAHINSMTVFARCVHGYMYYPSVKFKDHIHPTLTNHNLLLEQVEALHKEGIKAPVYIAVQWDRFIAERRPEWLIRKESGAHEGASFLQPGFDQSLCVNTKYYDFLKEHTIEVMDMLGEKLDGLFFDMVGVRPCYCSECRKEMRSLGINMNDEMAVRQFAKHVMDRFKQRMTEVVRSKNEACTIFYNAGHIGPCTQVSRDTYTHYELESIPSGQWGYLHFPITARYARTLNKDCLGMTGKFHTEWGDFHSLKNLAALEFECFRILSYGFAASIGDQLEPNGQLNKSAYKLIGKVYEQIEQYEPYARPSKALVEAALVTSENELYELKLPESIMGASQMLEELGLQFDIIDTSYDLVDYKLIILTDDLLVDDAFQIKIEEYVKKGGKVLACGKGGLSKKMKYPESFCVEYKGEEQIYPSFVVPNDKMAQGLEAGNEYVIYQRGEEILPSKAGKIILGARVPYFKREGIKFCSHIYTPSAKGDTFPAAVQGNNTILFAHPYFSQYRQCAPYWCKQLIKNAIDELLEKKIVKHNGPSYLSLNVLHQPEENRYCVHALSYIPIRKSATIDILEERNTIYDIEMEFHLPNKLKKAYSVMDKKELPILNGIITVPRIDGYGIIELSY